MYRALIKRDPAYDGVYFVGVKTTGVFCRPTCPAKKPHAKNIEFFENAKACLLAGYRPCKRCRPMDFHREPPKWVKGLIDLIERAPGRRIASADLRTMSIDPARAARYFKRNYGMTFQAFHRARRMGLALAAVRQGAPLDHVGQRHGFESISGFRDAFTRVFGTPPGRSSANSCLLARWLDTPLGPMVAAAADEGLCLLEFVDRRMLQTQLDTLRRRFGAAIVPGSNRHLDHIADELTRYFDGKLTRFDVPLVLRGTPFQLRTWKRLLDIPGGETLSYSQMAEDIGTPGAHRAVGRANGDNRIAIVIPCHRVVRADGTLCGYGGGVWRKQWLLDHERRITQSAVAGVSGRAHMTEARRRPAAAAR
jgi:AraC family transcriptional regulator of adaptative response/methylated-DNA-[protein]-cysteine methyltransferase